MRVRDLTYLTAVSLDGFIADAAGDFGVLPEAPDLIAAMAEDYPETFTGPQRAVLGLDGPPERFDTVLMGSGRYNCYVARGLPSPFPHLTQIVLARQARELALQHPDVQFTDAPASEVMRALQALDSTLGVWLAGGAQLAASLEDHIDRLVLKVSPTILGDGVPLFAPTAHQHALQYLTARPMPSGSAVASYRMLKAEAQTSPAR